MREWKSFHRQASKSAANHPGKQKTSLEDLDQLSDKVLPDKIAVSEIKGDFEVDLRQPDG